MKSPYLFLILCLFFFSCEDKNGNGLDPCINGYDQSAMFTNMVDALIIPAFEDFQTSVDDLRQKAVGFTSDPSVGNLDQLRASFSATYLTWQAAAPYNFGPAEEVFLRTSVNSFPLDVEQVEKNISEGGYDLEAGFNEFARGLPALDYLFHGLAMSNQQIVDRLKTEAYTNYMFDVISDIQRRVDHVVETWNGTYRKEFIDNVGTATGSSLGLVVNALNEHYEVVRRTRVGVPSGAETLGFTNPERVEAFYSGISIDLLRAALNSSKAFYAGQNGQGFDDYLTQLGTEKDGQPLGSVTLAQYDNILNALNDIDGKLSDAVENQMTAVEALYVELQKQTVNIKTDMPSVMCVAITYVDNPSDSD